MTSYTYDALGNLTSETDALGNTVKYTYTPEGWLKTVTDAEGRITRYTYDRTGNVLTADYAGEQTEISKTVFDHIFANKATAGVFNRLFPLNLEYGAGIRDILSSSGDTAMFISVFSENRVDDYTQSTAGIVINSSWLSIEQSFGITNTGTSIIGHFNDTDVSAGLHIDLENIHVVVEVVITSDAGEGRQNYSYYNISVNPILPILIYLFAQTGDPAVFQPA